MSFSTAKKYMKNTGKIFFFFVHKISVEVVDELKYVLFTLLYHIVFLKDIRIDLIEITFQRACFPYLT